MLELVMVFCMIGAPDRCIERDEPVANNASQFACVSLGQQLGQDFVNAHPGWRLVRWHCQDAARHQDPA